jgi:hypothetical protein
VVELLARTTGRYLSKQKKYSNEDIGFIVRIYGEACVSTLIALKLSHLDMSSIIVLFFIRL